MTDLTSAPRWAVKENTDRAVSDFVARILKLAEPPAPVTERRRDKRSAFPHLLTLTPIDDQLIQTTGEPMTVVGKRLAERGLDFFHQHPLPFKRAIVSFDELELDQHFVIKIGWCRFLRPGWYDSGGRFTHIVTARDETEFIG